MPCGGGLWLLEERTVVAHLGRGPKVCLASYVFKRRPKQAEEVMNDVTFSEPVTVVLPRGSQRKVATSFEAIECLQNEWPLWARGRSWRKACMACRNALDGWCSAKAARRRFIKAAKHAHLMPGYHATVSPVWGWPACKTGNTAQIAQ